MKSTPLRLRVNGKTIETMVEPNQRLLDFLRDELRLTGVKEGCGVGECGACTVIMNGQAVNSCLVLVGQANGADVLTVEGLAEDGELSPLQQSFIDHGAVHCGFCTPGMVMSAQALLMKNPKPSRSEIKTALSGNLCRCTGYQQIVAAVEGVIKKVGADSAK
ncbi:MAG: (2Fe-2S)-binding protein [Firmicutes bacterium]|nr:(2Fe-2S)-binding protein [Bacillota bacterium]MCL5039761.1 (2Fe-2S)-binding protein [Bacillota bacterium]